MAKKTGNALEAQVYSQAGKEVSKISLSEKVFGVEWNADLVHDVVVSMQSNARAGTAHTKGRGEVRGGGKKPWKQKGTGRARHGSTRSPIWAGGGVAHGPTTEKDYTRKINKNVRAKALASVLSQKFADGEIVFVDTISFDAPKSADARKMLTALSSIEGKEGMVTKRNNAVLVVLSGRDTSAELSFRNFGNVETVNAKDVNPVELLTFKYVVVAKPEEALKTLETRVSTKMARKVTAVKS